MHRSQGVKWSIAALLTGLIACGPKPTPVEAPPAAPPTVAEPAQGTSSGSATGQPSMIAIECTPRVNGYEAYRVTTLAQNLQGCSVGGDGMLTLYAKGEGNDSVTVHIAGYHGAGNYPLTGTSSLTLGLLLPSGGTTQTTTNCGASTACDVMVVDGSANAPAGTPHALDFAVNCGKLCDSDTHQCTAAATVGGSITWSIHADCAVR